jgi:hypothetical protein
MSPSPPTQLRDSEATSSIADEIKLIPRWAVGTAAIAFVFMQYLFWVVVPAHRTHPTTTLLSVRVYFSLSWSVMAALYVLMIGYVSHDAPRRNMNMGFWTVICLMPGGIGSVLYFLLRQPVMALCPSCGTHIQSEYHFCPRCAYQVSAACGNCYRGVRITDLYCAHCGHELSTDNTPARLRVYHGS